MVFSLGLILLIVGCTNTEVNCSSCCPEDNTPYANCSSCCPECNCSSCCPMCNTTADCPVDTSPYNSCSSCCPSCEGTTYLFVCYDGSVVYELSECDKQYNYTYSENNIDYKYSEYREYQDYIKHELESLTGYEDLGSYGGEWARYNGSVFFLMHKTMEWEFVKYWAVEVNATTGELIKYKDITSEEGDRTRFNETWWEEYRTN